MINYFYLSFIVLTFSFSTHCLAHDEVRGLDDMKRINGDRCAAYNSDSSEVRLGEIVKTKVDAIADYTGSINTFLTDKKNVNPKRHATQDQQRNILQSLMATAIIYGSTTTYANHGLSEGDALFWHFEILRAAEVLSFKYVESIKDYKNEKRRLYLAERQLEYDLLAKHGGITSDMFDMWFCEELTKHGDGFFTAANQRNLLFSNGINFTLYIQNNGERISNTVASGLESDLRTKKGTTLEHKAIPKKKYEMAVEGIKKEITTIRRGGGELLPILKKKSCCSKSENDNKPNTGRKLKGWDLNSDLKKKDDIHIQIIKGSEMSEEEIMDTYMWTKKELMDACEESKLRAGSISNFRTQEPTSARTIKRFKYDIQTMIEFLKNRRINTYEKIKSETYLTYHEIESEDDFFPMEDRYLISDTQSNGELSCELDNNPESVWF